MTSKQILKQWFANLKKPTQNHFWAWMDSYFHKEEKIPMQNIEGLDKVLENTASNEQMNNHFSDANAHKSLFDLKVDKEEGKGLSTNDYSNEEKQKLQETANKVVLGMSITGDVNKTLTLTREDGSVITTQFTDKDTTDNSPDVKLNSLNFDHQTGILKGVRSDNQELDVNLDGRYSLLNHKHSWNDLADKPQIPTNYRIYKPYFDEVVFNCFRADFGQFRKSVVVIDQNIKQKFIQKFPEKQIVELALVATVPNVMDLYISEIDLIAKEEVKIFRIDYNCRIFLDGIEKDAQSFHNERSNLIDLKKGVYKLTLEKIDGGRAIHINTILDWSKENPSTEKLVKSISSVSIYDGSTRLDITFNDNTQESVFTYPPNLRGIFSIADNLFFYDMFQNPNFSDMFKQKVEEILAEKGL